VGEDGETISSMSVGGMANIEDPWSPGGHVAEGDPGNPMVINPAPGKPITTAGGGTGLPSSQTQLPLAYYRDFSTEYRLPHLKSEITNDLRKVPYVDISSEYNYQIKKYEDAVGNPGYFMVERVLPNMYVHLAWAANENKEDYRPLRERPGIMWTQPEAFRKHITQGGKDPFSWEGGTDGLMKRTGDYFKNWADLLNHNSIRAGLRTDEFSITSSPMGSTAADFINVVFPLEVVKQMTDVETFKETFPMHTTIEFSTDTRTQFADILHEFNMTNPLLRTVMATEMSGLDANGQYVADGLKPEFKFKTLNRMREDTYVTRAMGNSLRTNLLESESVIITKQNKVLNLNNYFDTNTDNLKKLTNHAKTNSISLDTDAAFKNDDITDPFIATILGFAWKSKVREFVKQHARTYKDIISGKRAHSETVFYRVEKLDENDKVIQNFWFTNSAEIDVVKFVDTQVRYNKKYRYNIYAWQLVVGTKYKYQRRCYLLGTDGENEVSTHSGIADVGADVHVITEPELLLFETDYHISTDYVAIQDRPPVPPGVDMVPYRNVDNKILIALQAETGEYDIEPETLLLGEGQDLFDMFSYIRTLYPSMPLSEFRNSPPKITFKSDDEITHFEVYKTDKAPESYADFLGKKLLTMVVKERTTFIDDIEPNRKYYYTFKSIDTHGHKSNPTAVYELEMVKNSEVSYPVIRVISFEDMIIKNSKVGRQDQKKFKKYLYIKPAITHLLFNNEKSELTQPHPQTGVPVTSTAYGTTPVLGLEEQTPMNQVFKFRITSKKSGRKIDFNVTFKEKLRNSQSENTS